MKAALVALLLCAVLSRAQNQDCSVPGDQVCYFASFTTYCSPSWFNTQITNGDTSNLLYTRYVECIGEKNTCCGDLCRQHQDPASCAADSNCVPAPGEGMTTVCVNANKLCWLLTQTNCAKYSFCKWSNDLCSYVAPSSSSGSGATLAPSEGIDEKCAALHPMAVAMLVLMFVTFVAGIIIVGVVVYLNQKRADEEEARAEAETAKRQAGGRPGL